MYSHSGRQDGLTVPGLDSDICLLKGRLRLSSSYWEEGSYFVGKLSLTYKDLNLRN